MEQISDSLVHDPNVAIVLALTETALSHVATNLEEEVRTSVMHMSEGEDQEIDSGSSPTGDYKSRRYLITRGAALVTLRDAVTADPSVADSDPLAAELVGSYQKWHQMHPVVRG